MTAAAAIRKQDRINFENLEDRTERQARREFLRRLTGIRDSAAAAQLLAGDGSLLLQQLGIAADTISNINAATFIEAAAIINRLFPEYVFDPSSPSAALASALQRNSLRVELVGSIDDFLRAVNEVAARQQLVGDAVTRLTNRSMGLNGRGLRAVDRFRRGLEERSAAALQRDLGSPRFEQQVQAAIRRGEALSNAQIDAFTERYRRVTIARRVELVARLHAQRAIGESVQEFLNQLFANTRVTPEEITIRWNNSPPNVRDSHQAMNLQTRGVGQPFESGRGNFLRYPGDPQAPLVDTANCKCFLDITRN